jgi:uncharacterized protein (TIGR00645 family)
LTSGRDPAESIPAPGADIPDESKTMDNLTAAIGRSLYQARLLMSVLYIGLAIIIALLVFRFGIEVWKLSATILFENVPKIDLIIKTLEIVDMVMVVQLVWVVALAGFSLFVTDANFRDDSVAKPDWLSHVTTYNLKLKLAFAIISISGVHALKTYLEGGADTTAMLVTVAVHVAFVLSAIGIAAAERMTKSARHE